MATWTEITNDQVAAGAPVTTALMTALRDNVTGIAQRASGAPKIFGVPYDFQEFTTSGTWTKPSNAETGDIVVVQVVSGAGGAARDQRPSQGAPGIIVNFQIDDLSATEDVEVGSGGAGRADTTYNGGGDSWFGDERTRQHVRAEGSAMAGGFTDRLGSIKRFRDLAYGSDSDRAKVSFAAATGDADIGVFTSGTGSSSVGGQNQVSSIFGGGCGGMNNSTTAYRPGGFSVYAGHGGMALAPATGDGPATFDKSWMDGEFPGGGAGSCASSIPGFTTAGDGADGVVRVWCIKRE